MTKPARRLVVFGDDWGRHPSTVQHLVRGLLPRYQVDWVNTVGTRPPQLSLADLRRGVEKLASWMSPRPAPATGSANPAVHSPVHWPSFRHAWERRLNRTLLVRALRDVLTRQPAPEAVVTTIAITADLAAAFPKLNWVYFCQDEFPEWPDLDSATLLAMEREMLPRMRTVIAVSDHLQRRFRSLGCESGIVTPGIDLDMWRAVVRRPAPPPGARPVATFWGLADARLDSTVCAAIAAQCDLVMVGPQARVAPALLRHPAIRWQGAVAHAELPRIAAESDVLVMPYGVMPATLAMQPLKLKEYLATGLPVVATRLPATEPWADALDLATGPDEFVRRILERARAPLPAAQRDARRRLAGESWAMKSREFERLLLEGAIPAGDAHATAVPVAS